MKKVLIIWFAICICSYLKGQDTGSYIHFNMGGGTHQLGYKLTDGNKTTALGYTANFAYSYFFLPQFGLQTGLGLQTFNSSSTLNGLFVSPDVDTDGDAYDLRMNMKGWKEKQSVAYLDIPLKLQMKSNLSSKAKLLTSVGVKYSIPVYKHYEVTEGQMTTTGYYSKWNLELYDLPQHGFTTITERYKGSINLKPVCLAIMDVGGLIRLSGAAELYIGAYANYGLTNMMSHDGKLLYQHDGVYNGVANSTIASNEKQLSAGAKIGVYFNIGRMKPKIKPILIDTLTDTDKDGVPDFRDKCPGTSAEARGMVNKDGCPLDTDDDGVPDYLDKCLGTPVEARGMVDKNGCPLDSDGDGVPDYLDKCPNTPAEAKSLVDKNGCPLDSDGDGVPDYLDKCPNTPLAAKGLVDKNGCLLDTDADGIPDYLDRCPTIPGVAANNGCPEIKPEVKKLFKKAMQGIQFESGKAIIKLVSFTILNDIATVLINNPSYLIEVQGHCDNTGNPQHNLILSNDRALSVKMYLVGKGVDEKRMTSKGYGDTMPIADNKVAWGRTLNRRVEFIVSFEKVEPAN
jgi:outer membrane protein OmpA-like peptidoglycan-associated protein